MESTLLSLRDIDFLLFEWLAVEHLTKDRATLEMRNGWF